MKRLATLLCAALALFVIAEGVQAGWGTWHYGGYQPWWNIFAKRSRCCNPEEARLQKFWHDYYHALRCYYGMLDNIDWVAYYKNHGHQIGGGVGCEHGCCGTQRVQFAPVFVSPTMQWCLPGSCPPPASGPSGAGPASGAVFAPIGSPGY
ncbi:MAG: hypothetical protein L0Y72_16140 [Gemmataceae bacterium]|nr:hypothetical protein [Gemmataceae bacterium]MCI0740578.1 hypothetical protein [Gemmataceae bacterium]